MMIETYETPIDITDINSIAKTDKSDTIVYFPARLPLTEQR